MSPFDPRYQAIAPDPRAPGREARLFWFRAHHHSLRHLHRASRAYERAWLAGLPAFNEWSDLVTAKRRADFCWRQLAVKMGW